MAANSEQHNMMVLGALLVGLYIYSRRGVIGVSKVRPGSVTSMPGSAGVGWQQVGVNALTGFLQAAASGINNGNSTSYPSIRSNQQTATDTSRAGIVQEKVFPYSNDDGMPTSEDFGGIYY